MDLWPQKAPNTQNPSVPTMVRGIRMAPGWNILGGRLPVRVEGGRGELGRVGQNANSANTSLNVDSADHLT